MEAQTERWIRPDDWLVIVREEYLRNFILCGGATVKVAVSKEDESKGTLLSQLQSLAAEENYIFAALNASSVKIHLMDKVFHAIAAQIPWKELSSSFVWNLLNKEGYSLPDGQAGLTLSEIARLNERDETRLRQDIKRLLEKRLLREFHLCQEFRLAVIEMCLEVFGQGNVQEGVIEEWLRGGLRGVSALKPALIFQKIARHNARHMLISLAYWIKLAGKRGLVLVLDISRYMVEKRSKDANEGFYYSRPAVLDVYEVLRQLIDGTDDLQSCFVTVLANPEFLGDARRGLSAYDAFRLRIEDEVHDRHRPNPLSSLLRISRGAEPLLMLAGKG